MKIRAAVTVSSAVVMAAAIVLSGCERTRSGGATPLRLGWQAPWANQGQVVEVLKNTDVLKRNDSVVDFRSFTYGGPMTEAALAGQLDMLFVGDQPAITLMSRDANWRIVARMVNYRSAILVPMASPARTLRDLSGEKIAAAFGSTTHRDAVRIVDEAGLEVGKDIHFVSLDQAEHAGVIARGGNRHWGDFAAIATYDPTVAVAVLGKQARILIEWASPGVVVVSKTALDARTDDLRRFLGAYIEAFSIYAQNPNHFDALYEIDSRLPLSPPIYRMMAAYEPNLSVTDPSKISISIDAAQKVVYQRNADIAMRIGIIKQRVDIAAQLDSSLAEAAMEAERGRNAKK